MLDPNEVWNWLTDPANWAGRYGLANLLVEHLSMTFTALVLSAIIAIPLGIVLGHFNRGGALIIGISSASRAIPTMGLLFALVMLLGVNFRQEAAQIALMTIAIPPMLAGTYSGIDSVPLVIRQSAVAQGMTARQQIWHVELPIAAASLIGGLRLGFIQVVSTVVIAPLVGLGGLGFGVVQGLALRDFSQLTGSALLIVILTVAGDRLFAMAQTIASLRLNKTKRTT